MAVVYHKDMPEDMAVFLTDGSRENYRKVCTELGLNGYVFSRLIEFPNAYAFQYVTFDEQENRYSAFVLHPKHQLRAVEIRAETQEALEIARGNIAHNNGEYLGDCDDSGIELYDVPDEFGRDVGVMLIDALKTNKKIDEMVRDDPRCDEGGKNE